MDNELEINLMDLLYYMLRKWRRLLAWGLIFLIVVDLGMSYRDYRSQVELINAQMPTEDAEEIDYTEEKAELTTVQVEEVDELVGLYQEYQEKYETIASYYEESLLMKVDANAAPKVTLQYYVDNGYKVEYPVIASYNNVSDIVSALGQSVYSNEVYVAMADAIGWEEADSYMEECISTDNYDDDGSARLIVYVTGLTEEDARALAAVLDAAVETAAKDLQDTYGTFTLTKSESYQETADDSLRDKQKNAVSSMQSMQTSLLQLKNSLTTEQQEYFQKRLESEYVSGEDTEEEDETSAAESSTTEEVVEEEIKEAELNLISVKYMAFGFVVGIFLGCAYYAMLCMISAKLRAAGDIRDGYGLHIFGTYRIMKKEKPRFGGAIDEWLERLFRKDSYVLGEEENIRRICTEIEIAVDRNEAKKIHLTGASDSQEARGLAEQIREKLSGRAETVTEGGSVVFDTESLEKLTGSDAVILVEQVGVSKYGYMEGELNICKQYQVPVLGVVVVE